jgi:hypothetical protein
MQLGLDEVGIQSFDEEISWMKLENGHLEAQEGNAYISEY